MSKLEVGQKVFIKPMGNAARYSKEIKEGVVTKVARKYFWLDGFYKERFFIDSMVNDGHGYSSDYAVYLSAQEIEDEREAESLRKEIVKLFEWSSSARLTIDQMRRIIAITKETP